MPVLPELLSSLDTEDRIAGSSARICPALRGKGLPGSVMPPGLFTMVPVSPLARQAGLPGAVSRDRSGSGETRRGEHG